MDGNIVEAGIDKTTLGCGHMNNSSTVSMSVQVAWALIREATEIASPVDLTNQALVQQDTLQTLQELKEDGQVQLEKLNTQLSQAQV